MFKGDRCVGCGNIYKTSALGAPQCKRCGSYERPLNWKEIKKIYDKFRRSK